MASFDAFKISRVEKARALGFKKVRAVDSQAPTVRAPGVPALVEARRPVGLAMPTMTLERAVTCVGSVSLVPVLSN